VETQGQLDATDWFFIAKLMVLPTCFGHHYAHHQEQAARHPVHPLQPETHAATILHYL